MMFGQNQEGASNNKQPLFSGQPMSINISPQKGKGGSGAGGGDGSQVIQQKLNQMHRNVNKQIYELDSMIDSVYYGKIVDESSGTRMNKDFNFGYDQNSTSSNSSYSSSSGSNFKEVSEAQVQFMQSKISSIQVYYEDLKMYYMDQK